MKSILCIDGGATSSKWALRSVDGSVKKGSSRHFTGHIFSEAEWERASSVIDEIAQEVIDVDEIFLGITGLDGGNDIAKRILRHCQTRFKCVNVRVSNDMELAHSAFFEKGEGAIIYAGTGAVAVTRDKDGVLKRAGGWGFMIADEGSGFWIGRESLRHMTQFWDNGKEIKSSVLANKIFDNLKILDWNGLREYVYGGGRQAVAALAPLVAEASKDGSDEANQILRNAGRELRKLLQIIIEHHPTDKFVALGGVFNLSELILLEIRETLEAPLEHFNGDIPSRWLSMQD